MEHTNDIKEIASAFCTDGKIVKIESHGNGLINKTFMAYTPTKKYIFQKINTDLFDPEALMHNIRVVSDHLSKSALDDGKTLSIVKTKSGADFYERDKGAFRMYECIEDSVCYDKVNSNDDFYKCGYAFGKFASNLDGFDAKQLFEIIPNFHNTVDRMRKFKAARASDALERAKDVEKEIKFFLDRESYCSKITSLLDSGEMPTRVTHNDTKLNNILFSEKTGKPLAIIDLDTVMPGSVCYDFGDSIRFGCNTAAEDEPDTDKVGFSTELFEAYVKGYLKGFDKITPVERKNLLWGAILMTYECGMRFLTDYLEGDTYFHTQRKGQNLDRARTQIRMVELMEKDFDKLQNIIS